MKAEATAMTAASAAGSVAIKTLSQMGSATCVGQFTGQKYHVGLVPTARVSNCGQICVTLVGV